MALSWLTAKAVDSPSTCWRPDPTIKIKIETATAETVEKAMPRCADPSSLPSAMAPPWKRLYPTEVVLTRLIIISAGSADVSVLGGRFGIKPHRNLVQSMSMETTTTKKRVTMPIMRKPSMMPSLSVLSQYSKSRTMTAYTKQLPTLKPTRLEGERSAAPGIAITASTPPAKLLHLNSIFPKNTDPATSQQMMAVLYTLVMLLYLVLRHWPSDCPDTMVSLAVPSCKVKAMRAATTRPQIRFRPNSAPALEQVTTVPGPTVHAASMVQYNMESTSLATCELLPILVLFDNLELTGLDCFANRKLLDWV